MEKGTQPILTQKAIAEAKNRIVDQLIQRSFIDDTDSGLHEDIGDLVTEVLYETFERKR